jgi:hypothetical protein
MEKTYTIAGTTLFNGVKTFRFANGKLNLRINMLRHFGHDEINLVELPKAMTKVQATAWLLQNVRGTKNAVIPTRAADKTAKNELLLAAEKRAAAVAKARASRKAKQGAKEAVEA